MPRRKKSKCVEMGGCNTCGAPILCKQDVLDNIDLYTRQGTDGQQEAMVAIFTCKCRRLQQTPQPQIANPYVVYPGTVYGNTPNIPDMTYTVTTATDTAGTPNDVNDMFAQVANQRIGREQIVMHPETYRVLTELADEHGRL